MITSPPNLAQRHSTSPIRSRVPTDRGWQLAAGAWLCLVPAFAGCSDTPAAALADAACGPTKDAAVEAGSVDVGAGDAAAIDAGSAAADVAAAEVSTAGDADGTAVPAEVSVTVDNSAPSAPSVGLTTDAADLNSVNLTHKLTCSVTTASIDADGDAITYQYQWYVNTVADGAAIGAETLVANLKFQGADIKKGATIQCKVFASDGTKSSAPGHSAEVTVNGLDVCASKPDSCGAHATCTNTDTLAVVCACKPGYAGDGMKCLDTDECADGGANCAATAACANTDGSFTCKCQPGYVGDGVACADVNECLTLNGGCGDAKLITCQNVVAGPVTCADINECATGNGGCGDAKSFVCNNNYAKAQTCGGINTCAGGNGGCGDVNYWTCKENIGAPPSCTDIDECALNNGGCGDVKYNACTNKVGGPQACADIDECKANNGGCGSPAFHACKNNLNLAPTCTDINKCASSNGGCGSATFYTCSNNAGGAPTCADIDECKVKNGGCGSGICTNHVGAAATCTCSVAKGPALVNLGTAANFAVLAKTGISSVATSTVTGDIGVSPAAASFLTGFALTTDVTKVFAKSAQVTGKAYAADYSAPTPGMLTSAVSHMEAAYTEAAGRPAPEFVGLGGGNIGGKTLAPGLYKWSSNVTIPTDVILAGCPNDVWIFQITGNITMTADKAITLSGGAQAKNVIWQTSGLVSIGAGAHFEGSILSKTSITLQTGATMNGRALAQTLVALQKASVKP